jgi:Tol biopolymer transport system component
MTMQPFPDLLDLAEAVAAGTLRADDAEHQLRSALGPAPAGESEQAVRELRGLIGAVGAVQAHARATREALPPAAPHLATTVASTPASSATVVPVRVTAGTVQPRSSNGGRGARRAPRRIWLLAAAALLLVGGAVAAGSGLVRLPSPVPPVPAPTLPVAVASPAPAVDTPDAVVAPSTAATRWVTGQELMDALSAEYGYTWSPNDVFDVGWWGVLDGSRSGVVLVEAPLDGPAKVRVEATTETVAQVGPHALRIARLLAPDSAPWIQEAIAQGLAADWASFATKPYYESSYRWKVIPTATGGQVRVHFVDPPVSGNPPFDNYLGVTFLPEPPPPTPRLDPGDGGIVLYSNGGEIWAVNPDGADAHLLLQATTSDGSPVDTASFWWAPDGSRLFYNDGGDVFAIATDGSPPVRIGFGRDDPRCPVAGVPCEGERDLAISPDGSRLAYLIGFDAIGLFDLATGQVTRIAFNSESAPGGPACDGPPAGGGSLQWSPDGTRFAFGKSVGPKVDGWCQSAIFTINVDGTDLRRLASSQVHAMDPRWSPDGSTIVFTSVTPRFAWEGTTDATRIPIDMDIHSVRADGSGLTALTSDGRSGDPHWTRDGRIVFIRWDAGPAGVAAAAGRGEVLIMEADGRNASPLDTTVPAETAAGCLVCPDPDEGGLLSSDGHRFWRPGQP